MTTLLAVLLAVSLFANVALVAWVRVMRIMAEAALKALSAENAR